MALVVLIVTAWFRFAYRDSAADVRRQIAALVNIEGAPRLTIGRLSSATVWVAPRVASRSDVQTTISFEAQRIVIALQEAAQENPTAVTLRGNGTAFLAVDKLDDAVAAFLDGVDLAPADADAHTDLSAALLQRADRSGEVIDAVKALDHAERALRLAPAMPAALFNRAIAEELLGYRVRAATDWQDYMRHEAHGSWRAEAAARLQRLETSFVAPPPSEPVAALSDDELHRAAETYTAWLDRALALEALPAWATEPSPSTTAAAARIGAALSAIDVQSPATALAEAVGRSGGVPARVRACLGDTIRALAVWRRAFEQRDRPAAATAATAAAHSLTCAGEDPHLATLPAAWAAWWSSDRTRAVELVARGMTWARQERLWRLESEFCELSSSMAISETRLSDATEVRLRGRAAAVKARDAATVGRFDELLGEAADEQGDQSAAWSYFRFALGALECWSSPEARYGVLSTVAIAAASSDLHGAAAALSNDLVDAAEGTGRASYQMMALLQRGRSFAAIGDPRAAPALADAERLLGTMPDGASRNAWAAEHGWITGVVNARSNPQEAIRGLTTAIDYFERFGRRFRLAELLLHRGRAFRAVGDPGSAAADWARGADVLEDQRSAIRDEQLRISRAADVWGLFSELIELQLTDASAALQVFERAKARELLDSLARDREQRALSVADLQQCLPSEARAVIYAVLPSKLLTWQVTPTSVSLRVQAIGRQELERLVARHVQDLALNKRSSAGDSLTALLFESASGWDPSSPLIVVPDGPLARVPFAALPFDGQWLVQKTTPILAPSLTTFCVSSQRRSADASNKALLVGAGDANPEQRLPALHEVSKEIAALSNVYATRAEALVGADARADAVMRALPNHTIVHIASHARVDDQHPQRSRFFMSPQGTPAILAAQDIAATRLQYGTNVVLAACSTAAGKEFSGEGTMSLARPFLAAGALAVLGSLWDVRDAEARVVMERVHRRLAAGEALEMALAAAQRELIAGGGGASQWSAYVVVGGTVKVSQNRSRQ